MHQLRFLDSSVDLAFALPGSYNPILVTLSVVLASLAAYAALGLVEKISAAERLAAKRIWLTVGAVAMGIGVWAMHFVGMLAFSLPISVSYNVKITLLSIIPAILASGITLLVISRPEIRRWQLMVGGSLMGAGIGTMHYTGMAAMRMAAAMFYDPILFAISIIVAIALAIVSLHINRVANGRKANSRNYLVTLGAALVMGFAVAGMHYTGMIAVHFFPRDNVSAGGLALDPTLLSVFISVAVIIILGLAIFIAIVDSRLKAAAYSVRMSRRRLLEAIESITEGFSFCGPDDRLVLCNQKYREFFFSDTDESFIGKPFEQILRDDAERGLIPEARGRVDAWVAERMARHLNPSGPFLKELRDGRWLQINEHKTEDNEIVAVYTDITKLKETEIQLRKTLQELKAAQNQLIESEKMASLGQLMAGIAHEINNPIGALTSTTDTLIRCVGKMKQILEDTETFPDVRRIQELQQLLSILEKNGEVVLLTNDRITVIINSLKNFVRPDEADFKKTDIHKGIDSTLTLLHPELRKEISVVKEYGDIPDIYCYPYDLNQGFMTLLRNAIEAIEGEGTIKITTTTHNGTVSIKISDTGRGMAKKQLESLFDLSFSTKESRVSMRMGLFNVYNTVQKHDGRIEVESEAGSGTTFTVFLPVE